MNKLLEDMGASNQHATSNAQCVEVLISKKFDKDPGVQWTLSVYSLENQPVAEDRAVGNFEIFHFMLFDWNRTIQKFLDDHNICYSIVQYFKPASLLTGSQRGGFGTLHGLKYYKEMAASLRNAEPTHMVSQPRRMMESQPSAYNSTEN